MLAVFSSSRFIFCLVYCFSVTVVPSLLTCLLFLSDSCSFIFDLCESSRLLADEISQPTVAMVMGHIAWLHQFLLACSHVYHVPYTCTIPFIPFVPLFFFVYAYINLCIRYCIHSFIQYMIGSSDVL